MLVVVPFKVFSFDDLLLTYADFLTDQIFQIFQLCEVGNLLDISFFTHTSQYFKFKRHLYVKNVLRFD